MFRHLMFYGLLCLTVMVGNSCDSGHSLDVDDSGKDLLEVRYYLKTLKEGTRLVDMQQHLGLYNPSAIDSPTASCPWYTVRYKMRCYSLKVAAYLDDGDDSLLYAGETELITVFGEGVFPAVVPPLNWESSKSDETYLRVRSYLKSVPVGTQLSVIERELGLPVRRSIDPPSRLLPVYTVRYKTEAYGLMITASAPTYDRFAVANRGKHPLSDDLRYKGEIAMWETMNFRQHLKTIKLLPVK